MNVLIIIHTVKPQKEKREKITIWQYNSNIFIKYIV